MSPVRYFLRDTIDENEEYNSFTSLGSELRSVEQSYDYRQEDEYVKQAAQGNGSMTSNGYGGKGALKKKGRDEDMPYRPAEDDWEAGSDDSGVEDGEGIVRGGALEGRAATRGTRKDKGEGYLGMGLGINRRRTGKSGDGAEEDEFEVDDGYSHRETTPIPSAPLDVVSPDGASRYRKSPTPALIVARAFSPMVDRRPPVSSRKRKPSTGRTIITNLLHGLVLALRFVVESARVSGYTLFVQPFQAVFGSGRQFLKALKTNWWKWALGLLFTSVLLRLPSAPIFNRNTLPLPLAPPGSMKELVGRLAHLEQAVSLLSDSSNLLAEAERAGKQVDEDIIARMAGLEGSLALERKRVDGTKLEGSEKLRSEINALKKEVGDLGGRVGSSEKQIQQSSVKLDKIGHLDQDVQALKKRVDDVEREIKAVLEDGRLRAALERILPQWMPVRVNSRGTIDVDPAFWTEMRKMLVGKGDVESIVRSTLVETSAMPKSDKDLEAWGERFVERKTGEGAIIGRQEFVQHIEKEVLNLKELIQALPRHQPQPSVHSKSQPSSSVTIKTAKGDDITSVLQDLIDAALLRYSKDTIARPDYALFTAGARVIPSITSDTLVMRQPGFLGKVLMGKKPVEGRSPATALHPDISVGSCWPFAGSVGQLGVLLNRRAVISDITIEHAAAEVALDTSTAPKNIEVVSRTSTLDAEADYQWGMIEGDENKAKVAEYNSRRSDAESVEHTLSRGKLTV